MDLATVGGFLFAMIMIALGAYFEHVTLQSMIGMSAFMIVIGGTVGATVLSHAMEELKAVGAATKMTLFPPKRDYHGMVELLVSLAEKARRNGLLSLQEDAENASNTLVKRGLTMAVDGADPEAVIEVMEALSEQEANHVLHAAAVWDTAGGYAPTLGIMGTVMGLVTIMGNLSEPDTLGPAIAVAFLATLYGVGFANLIFLPLGAKIKALVKQQNHFNEMVILGITGIQSGENPRNLREKLSIYVPHVGSKGKAKATAPAQEGA
ncbi:MAG: flagellar motor protein [Bacillota bacterium]